jgi:DNA-binding winged helix-turn-helix (wHTH) protein
LAAGPHFQVNMPRDTVRFGPYTLDIARLELRREGVRVRIQPKPLALLVHLARNSDRVVSHEEIFREVWPGVHVEPGALKSALHSLRRALAEGDADLGPEGEGSRIVSLHGHGYRFVEPLEVEGEAARRSDSPAAPPPLPETRSRPRDFVDRKVEMSRLRALCHTALRGERQIVLLGGPPGIGKTRTAGEVAREAEALGFETHIGRAHEGDGAPPFWPWAQIVRSWTLAHGAARLEELAGAGSRAADLLGLAPELEPGPTAHPAAIYGRADQARFRTLDRVAVFLAHAARERPLLLILDDLHRADSASLELLLFVAQHVTEAPLAIVGTHRPLEPAHPVGRVLHEPATCSIPLAGLVRGSVGEILAQAGARAVPGELVDQVHAASGGNPLFVYELARALAAGDAAATLPARVHDAVWARICECSPECLEVLRLVSAAGPELALPVLRAAFGGTLDGAALLGALEEAERRDLLTGAGGSYGFVHGVVREALYEKLGPTERMQVHLRIGEALESLPGRPSPTRLAALAHHFLEGAPLRGAERAVHYAQRAAQAARAVCAFPEEVELRRRLVQALDFSSAPDPEQRGRALVDVGDALGHAAAPIAEFQEAFVRALVLARKHGSYHLLACAAERCVWHMSTRGAFLPVLIPSNDQALVQALIADLVKVQESPDVRGDPVLHARVLLALTQALAEDRPEESRRALDESIAIATRSADVELRGEILVHRYAHVFDDLDARDAVQRELLAWTVETRNQTFEVEAHQLAARNALERGDRAAYDRAAAELERLAGLGFSSAAYHLETWRGVCAQMEGPLVAASAQAQRLARTGGRMNLDPGWVMWTLGLQMGWLMLQAGMTDMLLLQSDAYAERVGPVAEMRMSVAWLRAAVGRHDEARPLLRELPRKAPGFGRGEIWICATAAAAEACILIGDRELALPIFDALAPHAGRVASFVTLIFGPVSRHLGGLAALLGRWDAAARFFDQAARKAQELRAPVFATLVDADRALAFRAHPDANERARSERLRVSAERAARALGMHLVAARLARTGA